MDEAPLESDAAAALSVMKGDAPASLSLSLFVSATQKTEQCSTRCSAAPTQAQSGEKARKAQRGEKDEKNKFQSQWTQKTQGDKNAKPSRQTKRSYFIGRDAACHHESSSSLSTVTPLSPSLRRRCGPLYPPPSTTGTHLRIHAEMTCLLITSLAELAT